MQFQYVSILRFAIEAYRKSLQAEQEMAEQRVRHDQKDRDQWTERTRKVQLLGQVVTDLHR